MPNKIEDGGPRKWSGGFGEKKYLVLLSDIEPRTVQSVSPPLNLLRFPTSSAERAQTTSLQPHELPVPNKTANCARFFTQTRKNSCRIEGASNTVLGRHTEGVPFLVQSKYHYWFSTEPAGTFRAVIRSYQRRESSMTFEEFEPVIEETESKGRGGALA